MIFRAVKCACGHRACQDWHVSFVASVQGVRFTQEQAELVAMLLTMMEKDKDNAESST
jgi:hypothetical protein